MKPIHYDAFISYRHCPLDSRIAEAVQKQLEHYTIPRAIRKGYGVDRIKRVFRDKEELPLCNDLGDSITAALTHSEYLILICSPRTKESQWVTREIETFLETHPVNRVLVVLAEGEPEDVVPPILLEGREPLHCDYRIKLRRAKEEELPRLVAAMVGCGYDDLVQRQKQYRTRRAIIALSALLTLSLALTAYFIHTSRQIRYHYEEQLKSQSRYLAKESLEHMDEGDRMGAIDLALAALPGEGNERPWLPEAEYALGVAVGAYTSDDDIQSLGSLQHHGLVQELHLSPDRAYIISRDDTHRVYVWDMDSRALLYTVETGDNLRQLLLMEGGRLLVYGQNALGCYDLSDGKLLWDCKEAVGSVRYCNETDELFMTPTYGSGMLCVVRKGSDGSLTDSVELSADGEVMAVSEDGRYIAYKVFVDYSLYEILIHDRKTGKTVRWEQTMEVIFESRFIGDRLVLMGMIEENYGMSLGYSYLVMSEKKMDLFALSATEGKELWHRALPYYFESYFTHISFGELDSGLAVFATLANLCYAVDLEEGELLQTVQMPDSAVGIREESTQLRWFLKNGFLWLYTMGDTEGAGLRYFPNDIDMGQLDGNIVIHVSGESRLTVHGRNRDDSLVLSEDPPTEYIKYLGRNRDYILLDTSYSGSLRCLSREGTLLWEQADAHTSHLLAMTETEAIFYDGFGEELYCYSLADGRVEERSLYPTGIPEMVGVYIRVKPIPWGDALFYVIEETDYTTLDSAVYLCTQRLSGGEVKKVPLHSTYDVSSFYELYPGTDGIILSTAEYTEDGRKQYTLCTVDPMGEMGEITSFTAAPGFKPLVLPFGEEGSLLIRTEEGMAIFNSMLQQERLIPGPFLSGAYDGVGDMLLLLDMEGTLSFYSREGTLLDQAAQYATSVTLSEYTDVSWTFTVEHIALQIDSVCNLIHRDSRGVHAYVYPCLFYDELKDGFYVSIYETDGDHLGYFPRYTTQSLIEKGKRLLGSNGLTEEEKKQYGILDTE